MENNEEMPNGSPSFNPVTGKKIASYAEEMEARDKIDQLARATAKGGKHKCVHSSLKEIRYVGIEFEPSKIQSCEKEVNAALSQGFEPIRDFETGRGLVMVLGLWKEE